MDTLTFWILTVAYKGSLFALLKKISYFCNKKGVAVRQPLNIMVCG
jgi:hypothetical protein